MYDILLTDAMVIPVDPEHHIWEKGYIAITGAVSYTHLDVYKRQAIH